MIDDRIKNIKIAVHNEEESRKVQEKLFELGVAWGSGKKVKHLEMRYLFIDETLSGDYVITCIDNYKKYFDDCIYKEIYVEDLLAMEVKEQTMKYICVVPEYINGKKCDYKQQMHVVELSSILETKQKILEDIWKSDRSIEKIEEILDKRIGDKK